MELAEFERRATAVWDEIPDAYRSGVDGLVIRTEENPHPSLDEIYTLGECLTESYLSDWSGPETTRSVLVLYHGSFQRLSELDPEFDWEYEIWETITHELRHHLESLATEDALEGVDYAMDENFKRFQGDEFDPFFYRSGERLGDGVFRAERDVFIERVYDDVPSPGSAIPFDWQGTRWTVEVPEETGDVTFLQVVDWPAPAVPDEPTEICLVLVRRQRFLDGLRRLFRRESLAVVDYDVAAHQA